MKKAPISRRADAARIEADPRWQALLAHEPRTDFVYGVKTTGVYGAPGDGARMPRPENVEFFATALEAEAAGYRSTRRTTRRASAADHARRVTEACRVLETAERVPGLEELAAAAGMSPFHFHRVFKAISGLTPKAYAAAVRARRLREGLGRASTVTEAIFDAGYGSSGRFYSASEDVLGMRPRDYRAGGANADIRFAIGACSLGAILVAQSSRGVCAIALGDDPDALARALQDRFPRANLIGADADFERVVAQVVGLIEHPARGAELPLDIRGTAFQERVWQALREIPAGTTATYREIACRIGHPAAVRAVAGACAANTLAVAIPCHRVVRSDGSLSGYRWGVERKRELQRREREDDAP